MYEIEMKQMNQSDFFNFDGFFLILWLCSFCFEIFQLCLNLGLGSIQKEFCISIRIRLLKIIITRIIDLIIPIIHEERHKMTTKFKSIARQIVPNRPLNFTGTSTVSR
jgi:hypothetical protein